MENTGISKGLTGFIKFTAVKNSAYFFTLTYALKVVSLYFLLSYAIDAYIALVDPNGRYDFSDTLGKVNFIALLRDSLLYPSEWLLKLFGYCTFITTLRVGIMDSGGVQLVYGCLGIKAFITLTALVTCFPAKAKNKFMFLLAALPVMHLLNIIRITILAVLNKFSYTLSLEHHDVYNTIIYAYIAASFYIFTEYFSERKIKPQIAYTKTI